MTAPRAVCLFIFFAFFCGAAAGCGGAVRAHEEGTSSQQPGEGARTLSGWKQGVASGKPVVWHPLTLTFRGPATSEASGSPHPFLDYRLDVELTSPSGARLRVPGFFDGDGAGGGTGDVWKIRFAAHEPGRWRWQASFRTGPQVAVSLAPDAGSPSHFDGAGGEVMIAPRDPLAEGFYRWGKLAYVGEHYLKFLDGPYFLKTGTNSPENLLGYMGFDNTFDQGGLSTSGLALGLHRFEPHVADFGPNGLGDTADPLFVSQDHGYDSRGIVGALNYLAEQHVNSVYFLPMNLGGDGQETTPFIGHRNDPWDKTRYDISKLAQWNAVFEHAQRKGILLHIVLGETEEDNENWLDGGTLGPERKLFYREMVARFGHHLAIKWNLGEEFDLPLQRIREFGEYLEELDPYAHPIAFHTYTLPAGGDSAELTACLGDPTISATSLQLVPWTAEDVVERWRAESAAAGRKWVVEVDEQTLPLTDSNAAELRKKLLWDVLLSGGGIEWYGGYYSLPLGGDLRLEDFRTREEMWRYSWYARRFFEQHLPFWAMEPRDDLVVGETASPFGGAEVLALVGSVYAVYYPDASGTGTLELTGVSGDLLGRWYDPRTGAFVGASFRLSGGGPAAVGTPPVAPAEDWVLLVRP